PHPCVSSSRLATPTWAWFPTTCPSSDRAGSRHELRWLRSSTGSLAGLSELFGWLNGAAWPQSLRERSVSESERPLAYMPLLRQALAWTIRIAPLLSVIWIASGSRPAAQDGPAW